MQDDEVDDNVPITKKLPIHVDSKEDHLSALRSAFNSGKEILNLFGNRRGYDSKNIGILEVFILFQSTSASFLCYSLFSYDLSTYF